MEYSPTNNGSASGTRPTPTTTKTKNSGPCDRNFEQKLSDVGVFYSGNLPPGAGPIPKPQNLAQLRERVLRRRPSLSPARFTDEDYEAFESILVFNKTEDDIMTNVITLTEGISREGERSCINKLFNNFRLLAAGMVCGTPDKYYGSNPADVLIEVHRELDKLIVPSTAEGLPFAPNFFLEVKSGLGMLTVAERQALHTGASAKEAKFLCGLGAKMGQDLTKWPILSYRHIWVALLNYFPFM